MELGAQAPETFPKLNRFLQEPAYLSISVVTLSCIRGRFQEILDSERFGFLKALEVTSLRVSVRLNLEGLENASSRMFLGQVLQWSSESDPAQYGEARLPSYSSSYVTIRMNCRFCCIASGPFSAVLHNCNLFSLNPFFYAWTRRLLYAPHTNLSPAVFRTFCMPAMKVTISCCIDTFSTGRES